MALAKYDLIRCWEEFRQEQKVLKVSHRTADAKFLESYNTGILYPEIYKTLKPRWNWCIVSLEEFN